MLNLLRLTEPRSGGAKAIWATRPKGYGGQGKHQNSNTKTDLYGAHCRPGRRAGMVIEQNRSLSNFIEQEAFRPGYGFLASSFAKGYGGQGREKHHLEIPG